MKKIKVPGDQTDLLGGRVRLAWTRTEVEEFAARGITEVPLGKEARVIGVSFDELANTTELVVEEL